MTTTKHLRITVNGKAYEVTAEILSDAPAAAAVPAAPAPAASAPVLAPPAAARPQPAPAAGSGELRSPLAGKVVSVSVAPGAPVAPGQTVRVLEAMKMNTMIAAPCAGTVRAVHVRPGEAVPEGHLLLSIG